MFQFFPTEFQQTQDRTEESKLNPPSLVLSRLSRAKHDILIAHLHKQPATGPLQSHRRAPSGLLQVLLSFVRAFSTFLEPARTYFLPAFLELRLSRAIAALEMGSLAVLCGRFANDPRETKKRRVGFLFSGHRRGPRQGL